MSSVRTTSLKTPAKDDPIAISSFPIDSHDCQRIALKNGGVINEGTIFSRQAKEPPSKANPYHVPYRAILPKPEQCNNLLVPVALSCTHVGISSLRIEGTWMIIGQSAGIAAALAAKQNASVQELDYQKLRERLLAQKTGIRIARIARGFLANIGRCIDSCEVALSHQKLRPLLRFI